MERKTKIIIIVAAILMVFLFLVTLYFSTRERTREEQERKEEAAIRGVAKKAEAQIGGVIIEKGFNISYEAGPNRIIVAITDAPFVDNENRALDYLEDTGINICRTNIIVIGSAGVLEPENHRGRLDGCQK